jgi:hypothetical protein
MHAPGSPETDLTRDGPEPNRQFDAARGRGGSAEKRKEKKRIYLRDAGDTRKSKPEGTEEAEIAPRNMGCGF